MPTWSLRDTGKKRKNKIRGDAKWTHISAIPIIKNLVAIGLTAEEIGLILEVPETTLTSWKQRYPDIFNANVEGKKILKGILCAEMFRSATGYNYEEVEKDYKIETDKETGKKSKVLIGEKHKTKHQHGNDPLKMFLAQNLLPEIFPRSQLEVHNNTLHLIANVEENTIREFAGKLYELVDSGKKQIESKVINDGQSNKESG